MCKAYNCSAEIKPKSLISVNICQQIPFLIKKTNKQKKHNKISAQEMVKLDFLFYRTQENPAQGLQEDLDM